jgi:hypothetical protein
VKELRIIAVILIVLAALPVSLRAQSSGTVPGSVQAGNAAAPASTLKITSPKSGERLRQNFVNVQYELMNAAASAAGTPTFRLKLDSQDPVTTTATNQTFSGLTPGPHTVRVQMVDANGTPITGAESEVQFIVPQPSQGQGAATALHHGFLEGLVSALHLKQR